MRHCIPLFTHCKYYCLNDNKLYFECELLTQLSEFEVFHQKLIYFLKRTKESLFLLPFFPIFFFFCYYTFIFNFYLHFNVLSISLLLCIEVFFSFLCVH